MVANNKGRTNRKAAAFFLGKDVFLISLWGNQSAQPNKSDNVTQLSTWNPYILQKRPTLV